MNNNFNLKTKIHMGCFKANDYLTINDNVFIVADKFMIKNKKIEFITKQLDNNKIKYEVFSDVCSDPDIEVIQNGIKFIKKNNYNIVIAIGGGSVLDAAKAIIFFSKKIYNMQNKMFIAIPTTSGTGSEVTRFSVISDKEKEIKYPIVDDLLYPDIAILDPSLTLTVPKNIVAETGIDVLTHAIESFVSTKSNIFTEALSQKAIELCFEHLIKSFQNNDYESKSQMLYASCLAGLAFDQTSLGLTHSFAHTIGALYHIPHGRANGMFLTKIIEYNTNSENHAILNRYSKISKFLNIASYNDRQSVKNLVLKIKKMMNDLNLITSIKSYNFNIGKVSIDKITNSIYNDICTGTNPRITSLNDIKDILLNMFHNNE